MPCRVAVSPLTCSPPPIVQRGRSTLLQSSGRPTFLIVPFSFLIRSLEFWSYWPHLVVWTRLDAMSWGFFLYLMWFNPGQSFQFYALLQHRPLLLLAQNIAGCIAQGVGLTGLLLFVLRVPNDKPDPKWRMLERALPLTALVLTLLLLASYGSVFGYRTELGPGQVSSWGLL